MYFFYRNIGSHQLNLIYILNVISIWENLLCQHVLNLFVVWSAFRGVITLVGNNLRQQIAVIHCDDRFCIVRHPAGTWFRKSGNANLAGLSTVSTIRHCYSLRWWYTKSTDFVGPHALQYSWETVSVDEVSAWMAANRLKVNHAWYSSSCQHHQIPSNSDRLGPHCQYWCSTGSVRHSGNSN